MVLSNKKLKQKLRAALTESLAAKEAEKQGPGAAKSDLNLHQTQTLKQLLSSTTQKLRLSKREIRRKNPPLKNPAPSQKSNDAQNENTSVASSGNKENKKNKKKRKRVDDQDKETGDGGNELMAENPPKKKKAEKKKERKKKKKTKGKEKEKREEENRDGASKAEVEMGDSSKMEKSQEIGDVPTKVYVGGIPYYSTEDDIRSFFDSCGTITEVDCMKFPESGKFRGIAMITFKTEAAAKRALALDGADMRFWGLLFTVDPIYNDLGNNPWV